MQPKPRDYFSNSRSEMLKFIPEGITRILDVGCGEGAFDCLLREHTRAELWGVEINQAAADKARLVLDRCLMGDIDRVINELPSSYFDCICFNDVLEHLVDPYSILAIAGEKLSAGGVVVFSLPNVRFIYVLKDLLISKDWKYEDFGVLDRTHLRFFTKRSIRAMFEAAGYEIVNLEGISGIRSWKFDLLNAALLGNLSDTRYMQIAGVARRREVNGLGRK